MRKRENVLTAGTIYEGLQKLSRLLLAGLFWVGVLGSAINANAQSSDVRYEFRIEEETLGSALSKIVDLTKAQLLYPHELSNSTGVNPVRGEHTIEQALQILLEGTEFSGGLTESGVIVVSRNQSANAPRREEDTVVSKPVRRTLLAGVSAFILGSSPAMAQDEGTQSSEERSEDEASRRLNQIVVTATRRETTLQDAPLSITALRDEDLAIQGIENYEDFARQIPGVTMTGSRNVGKFNIRGIETSGTLSTIGNQRSTVVYMDEVPLTSSSVVTPDLRLYDVERVEVLRGPQGTSFGSGSLAGAVRVISKKANTDGFEASFRLDAATTDEGGLRQRYNGMINLPLSDNLAIRAVGYVADDEGYIDNQGTFGLMPIEDDNSYEEWGGRISLRWDPTERFSATLGYIRDDVEGPFGSLQDPSLGDYRTATFLEEFLVIENDIYNLVLDYEFDWATLVSSSTYSESFTDWALDISGAVGGALPLGYGEAQSHEVSVQEVRLVSNTESQFEWLAGAYYFDRVSRTPGSSFISPAFLQAVGVNTDNIPLVHAPGVNVDPNLRTFENTEWAVFGELTYHFSDTLSGTVGIRQTELETADGISDEGYVTDIFPLIFGGQGGTASAFPDQPVRLSTGTKTATTMRFVLNWQPNDNQTLYVSASEGFRRPHPNFVALTPNLVDPTDQTVIPEFADSDSLWNFELGSKASYFDNRLQANIAFYFIDWDNVQLIATRASDATPYAANGGVVESMGVEAEFLFYPNDNLDLGLNVTLADAQVVSISSEDSVASGLIKGDELIMPKTQISGFVQQNWELDGGNNLFARMDLQYVDEYPNAPSNVPGVSPAMPNPSFARTDAYTNANLQFGWQSDRLTAVIYGENILNDNNATYINPDVFSANRVVTLRPRTVGVRLGWEY